MSRYVLEIIVVFLLLFWLLGWFALPSLGNLVHLLLVIVLIVIVIRLVRGKSPLG